MGHKPINRRQLLGALGGSVTVSLAGCRRIREGTQASPDSNQSDTTDSDETEYNTVVIFRNDDPAPWTDIEVLSGVNEVFINNEIPFTQGIVPYDKNEDEGINLEHEVCEYLNSVAEDNPELVENALHGYTHVRETDFFWGSEFGGLTYDQQNQKITNSLQQFDECFDQTPTTFIPPFNTYDEATVQVLAEKGFRLVSGGFYFQRDYFGKEMVWEDNGIIHLPANLAMEDSETQEVKKIDSLEQEYDKNSEEYSLNVIMLHYNRYSEEADKQVLEGMIQHALEDNSKFMTLGGFAEQIENGALKRTEDGWRVKETHSTKSS
ncbi:DUF2334 domain-containing protein [Natronoarchaeum sp. GCM10025321]|uniref:DUF2334 domain-containing protein n=1 Tax=Natronoarchaeum sp. GCM10025321 TaxID=3252684 RepID=UPI003606A6C9